MRHPHSRRARIAGLGALVLAFGPLLLSGCGGSLPRPPAAYVSTEDYVAVSYGPRPPPVEFVPPSPSKDAVWVDGSWEWTGGRYAWRFGAWMVPPAGAKRSRWVVVRRKEDGQLFFARSLWKDAAGKTLDDRGWSSAFGARGRARSRPGAAAAESAPAAGAAAAGRGIEDSRAPAVMLEGGED